MLQVHSFIFNAFSENTYVLTNEEKQCWIVDPGMYDTEETNAFLAYLASGGLKPQAIVNTHTHIDHIFGVNALVEAFNIPFGIHRLDLPVLQGARGAAALFGFEISTVAEPSFFISEGEPLMLGKDQLEVRFTPGHSPGSIVFYNPEEHWVVSGDVLFAGSIGRTDLPGGNYDTLIRSIREQLLTLPGDTLVYPGHGPETDIETERQTNPFLR